MNALLKQFLQDTREALEGISGALLAMERSPNNSTHLNELFRLVHTIKGNSGLFDFPALTEVLHAAEDLMDAVRIDQVRFNQSLADQLLEAADYVAEFLNDVETSGVPSSQFHSAPKELVAALRGWLNAAAASVETGVQACADKCEMVRNDDVVDLPASAKAEIEQLIAEGKRGFYVDFRPAGAAFFQGIDPLHMVRQLSSVRWRRVSTLQPWAPPAELDAYQCNLRFELLLEASEAQLAEHFRYVSDQVTWKEVTVSAVVSPVVLAATSEIDPLLLEVSSAQLSALAACTTQHWPSGQHQGIANTLKQALTGHSLMAQLSTQLAAADQSGSSEPLRDWLSDLLSTNAGTRGEASKAPGYGDKLEVGATDGSEANTIRKIDDSVPGSAKVLKVEQEKIDRLMNLIGEMVVAKNGLSYLAERAESHFAQRELAREIKAQYAVVNRIAEDMQDAIMQVRMMPVSFVLQRFPRLVRDIARKLGKKVNLVLEGEDTEADKAMIEALADPLVHIVRNSLDHGLETPQERLANGKPEMGTLRIRASQAADHVVISIDDDGRGIDPQKIKQKVLAKGLVEAAALDAMSDQDLVNLVFLPGFSTAEQISDLSGRGVGMDVVRSGIEKVGGQLRLNSRVGQGTELSLSLPLSMAVTKVMIIESGDQRFGIPMDQVVETVRLHKDAIHTLKLHPIAQLRGRTIPIKRLNELLAINVPQQLNSEGEYALMVLRSRGELTGLIIDDFHGSIDIILKPMLGILNELSGYSGTAVMGDGSILMILNPTELFE